MASKLRPSDGLRRERYSTALWPSRYTSFWSENGYADLLIMLTFRAGPASMAGDARGFGLHNRGTRQGPKSGWLHGRWPRAHDPEQAESVRSDRGIAASVAAHRILAIRGSASHDDWQGGAKHNRVACGPTKGPQDYADQGRRTTAAILMSSFGRSDSLLPKVSIIARSA